MLGLAKEKHLRISEFEEDIKEEVLDIVDII
jgi:hypothetical protein